MRVLIVDDNKVALTILRNALVERGHEVEMASNGVEAMERLEEGRCRLVISDWQMPEMDGIELCRAIRSSDLPGYVYVILLTSHDSQEEKVQGLAAGADDFISKPFDPPELLARLRAAERILSLETRDVTIFAMAKLAESRDPETGAHLERVRSYCRVLAQQLAGTEKYRGQIDAEYIRLVYQTSPLHDIGKVGIPDSILLKPDRLSDREFELMKTHTTIGARTLSAALKSFPHVSFLQMARDIAATHHERYDGTGYPARLAGEAIPLCGRIVALADAYDVLTSKRVYKEAFDHDVAKATIVNEEGKQFDPDVVAAFIQAEEQFMSIRNQYVKRKAPTELPAMAA